MWSNLYGLFLLLCTNKTYQKKCIGYTKFFSSVDTTLHFTYCHRIAASWIATIKWNVWEHATAQAALITNTTSNAWRINSVITFVCHSIYAWFMPLFFWFLSIICSCILAYPRRHKHRQRKASMCLFVVSNYINATFMVRFNVWLKKQFQEIWLTPPLLHPLTFPGHSQCFSLCFVFALLTYPYGVFNWHRTLLAALLLLLLLCWIFAMLLFLL